MTPGVRSRTYLNVATMSCPAVSGICAIVVYSWYAWVSGALSRPSPFNYYSYLADALLNGQIALRLTPPVIHDLIPWKGNWYLYWPPGPAFLLMPFVYLFGVTFPDAVVNILVGSGNVALCATILNRVSSLQRTPVSKSLRGMCVITFAFGTVHMTLCPAGGVWYLAQLSAVFCLQASIVTALRTSSGLGSVLAGILFSGVVLCRYSMLPTGLIPLFIVCSKSKTFPLDRLIKFSLPILCVLNLLLFYNLIRFGDALDSGVSYHLFDKSFSASVVTHGMASIYYVPRNLFYHFVAYPFPLDKNSMMGGSMVLLTPLFAAAIWGIWRERGDWFTWTLVTSSILTYIPALLLFGTGWVQFGPRYTYDFTVMVMMLVVRGVAAWPPLLVACLTLIGVVHYAIGTYLFVMLWK